MTAARFADILRKQIQKTPGTTIPPWRFHCYCRSSKSIYFCRSASGISSTGSVTMLLSLLTHSSSIAFIVSVVFMRYLSRVYPPPSQITDFLPSHMIVWSSSSNVRLVNIFGIYFDHVQFGLLLYLAIIILLLALCWLGWRRSAKEI